METGNKALGLIAIFIIIFLSARISAAEQAVPALVYHNIVDSPYDGDVPFSKFAAQMKYLHDNGYKTITSQELIDWRAGKITIPEKSVFIVFDDGRKTVYDLAYPEMKKYGFRGNVAVVSKYAGFTSSSSGYMNWGNIQELVNNGWGMQSHGLTHSQMYTLDEPEFRQQLRESKEIMEIKTGKVTNAFVFPHYSSTAEYTEICAEYYLDCWTVGGEASDPTYNYQDTDGHAYGRSGNVGLRRITVRDHLSISQFAAALPKGSSPPTNTTTNRAPVLATIPASTSINEGCVYTYDVNATDADGDRLTYTLSMTQSPATFPPWLKIDSTTGMITGTAPNVDGTTWTFTVTVKVSDGKGGSDSQTFKVVSHNQPCGSSSGNTTNRAPVLATIPASTSINEGCVYRYDVNATDADGDRLTYALSMTQSPATFPPWLKINSTTGLITGTAPNVDGTTWTFNVTARVSDGKATTSQAFRIVVHNKPCTI